ncbi:MAG: hydrogenase formation protein HypD [Desulfovibrionaceae bacterium]|nr:hydrogenase formation protein HypD [Desulfovibrionaceae bacterium]
MFNDTELAHTTIEDARTIITTYTGKPLRIMEVCGTHTHEIFRLGIRQLLPPKITLISGPGCPVCVTPVSYIDQALWLGLEQRAIICTFGDLIRVPGTTMSLGDARKEGLELRLVYSPLDAIQIAKENPTREVVFLSIGFETTVPGECLAVQEAKAEGLANFSLLLANKTMPEAYLALKNSADAFLFPGHVCAITGTQDCRALTKLGISGVVAGFTAQELMTALAAILILSRQDKPFFMNCYPRVVADCGNVAAQKLIQSILAPCDSEWRGLGVIPKSGLKLREEFQDFDAQRRFHIPHLESHANAACRCGDVLQGKCLPKDCKVFGKACTPTHPIGACMVSSEGTCAAYYQYGGM